MPSVKKNTMTVARDLARRAASAASCRIEVGQLCDYVTVDGKYYWYHVTIKGVIKVFKTRALQCEYLRDLVTILGGKL